MYNLVRVSVIITIILFIDIMKKKKKKTLQNTINNTVIYVQGRHNNGSSLYVCPFGRTSADSRLRLRRLVSRRYVQTIYTYNIHNIAGYNMCVRARTGGCNVTGWLFLFFFSKYRFQIRRDRAIRTTARLVHASRARFYLFEYLNFAKKKFTNRLIR